MSVEAIKAFGDLIPQITFALIILCLCAVATMVGFSIIMLSLGYRAKQIARLTEARTDAIRADHMVMQHEMAQERQI